MLNVLVLKSTLQPNNFSQTDWLLNQALQTMVSAVEDYNTQTDLTYQYINLDKFNLIYQKFTPYILERFNHELNLSQHDTKENFSQAVINFLQERGLDKLVEVVSAQDRNLDLSITDFTQQTLAEFSLFYNQLLECDPAKVKLMVRDVDALPFNYTYGHLQVTDQFNPLRLNLRSQFSQKFAEFNWFGETATSALANEFNDYYLSNILKPFYQQNLLPLIKGDKTRFIYSNKQDVQMYFELLHAGRSVANPEEYPQIQHPELLNALFDPCYADQAFNHLYHEHLNRVRIPTYNGSWDQILKQHVGFNFNRTTAEALASKVYSIGIYKYRVNSALSRDFPETHPSLALAQANNIINEFLQADLIFVACPVYNHNIPTKLKNYLDFWVRSGVTFSTDAPEEFARSQFPVQKRFFVLSAAGADNYYKNMLAEFFENYTSFINAKLEALVYRPYSTNLPCANLDPDNCKEQQIVSQQTLDILEEQVYKGVTSYLKERQQYLCSHQALANHPSGQSLAKQISLRNDLGPQLCPLLDATKLPFELDKQGEQDNSPQAIAAQLAHGLPQHLNDFSGVYLWGTYFRQADNQPLAQAELQSKPDLVMHLSRASVDYIHYCLELEQDQRSFNKVRDLASITPVSSQLCPSNWLQASSYPIDLLVAKDYERVIFYTSLNQYPVPEFTGQQLLAALQLQATYFKVNQGQSKVQKYVKSVQIPLEEADEILE
ncbi:hypothetical protein CKF54_05170 [Psittacicella hinzii]|uniref:Flavodoxin-like fold domain-containing protein n=1 Tax=Psittacicella hinzii TaxID=2028575 RepID=A0A3A1Y1Q3_9GAMM|nr:NAD(P)H-dependent oxidoreductase [Psittacicella hinzii]RIY32262.1 hypothetical protein CKF54_05170 [Psittacicella hinzii]